MSTFWDFAAHSPCQELAASDLFNRPIWVKRDDLLHPVVSGNKWRKLKYPLQAARIWSDSNQQTPTIVTMGGLWSNHVHATAYASQSMGMRSVGLIRAHSGMESAMLRDCRLQDMEIQFVDRVVYRNLREQPDYWTELTKDVDHPIWIPEGGSAPTALHGVAEIVDELPFMPDLVMLACGTGATLAGLLAGLKGRSQVWGIPVLNQPDFLHRDIARLLSEAGYPSYQNYQLFDGFQHGGYAKTSSELLLFCSQLMETYALPTEAVYTAKVFFALRALLKSGAVSDQQSVVVLHTGGLQGMRGFS